jgi:hypothetical protein
LHRYAFLSVNQFYTEANHTNKSSIEGQMIKTKEFFLSKMKMFSEDHPHKAVTVLAQSLPIG